MKAVVIGATGYIGSAVCRALKAKGHDVHGLARDEAKAAQLQQAGITPLRDEGREIGTLTAAVKQFDLLVFAVMLPFPEEAAMIDALLGAFRGDGKTFIFTSGTGVLSIFTPEGAWDENSFAEDDPFPFPDLYNRAARIGTENAVRKASGDGFRTMVIRPPVVFGNGGSVHIPQFFRCAEQHGKVAYLGHGLNLYSNVHVDDLAEAYALAVEKGVGGAVYHAVAGEADFRSIAEAVAEVTGCPAVSLDLDALCALCGEEWVKMGLAVNSRSRSPRARAELGWAPRHLDLIDDIRNGSYREAYRQSAQALGTKEAPRL